MIDCVRGGALALALLAAPATAQLTRAERVMQATVTAEQDRTLRQRLDVSGTQVVDDRDVMTVLHHDSGAHTAHVPGAAGDQEFHEEFGQTFST